jgi:hypothetical protein
MATKGLEEVARTSSDGVAVDDDRFNPSRMRGVGVTLGGAAPDARQTDDASVSIKALGKLSFFMAFSFT